MQLKGEFIKNFFIILVIVNLLYRQSLIRKEVCIELINEIDTLILKESNEERISAMKDCKKEITNASRK